MLACAALVAPVTACEVSSGGLHSSSFRCSNAECRISLTGAGAEAEIDALGTTFRLVSVDDDTATIRALGEELTLREGESAQVGGIEVTADRIDGNGVELTTGLG